MIEFTGVPHARAGENADANPSGACCQRDREANGAAIVNHVDADWYWEILHDFGGGHGVRRHRFGLHVVANVVGKVPHVFDREAIDAALHERFSVAQRVIDDFLHAVTCVPGGAGKRPEMDHADYGLGDGKKIGKRFHSRAVELFFPFGQLIAIWLWRHVCLSGRELRFCRRASALRRTASHFPRRCCERNSAATSREPGSVSPAPTNDTAAAPPAVAAMAASSAGQPRRRACKNPATKASPAPVESTIFTSNDGTCCGPPLREIREPLFPSFRTTSRAPAFSSAANARCGSRAPVSSVASSVLRSRISTPGMICKIFRGICWAGAIPTSSETQPPRA